MSKTQELAELAHDAAELKKIQERLEDRVYSARAAGASWAEIGSIVGISKQAAQQRFGKAEKQDAALARWREVMAAPDAQEPETTSIFLEPEAPAKAWTPAEGSPLHSYDTRDTSDWYTKYGCGECGRKDRPDSCRNCHRR